MSNHSNKENTSLKLIKKPIISFFSFILKPISSLFNAHTEFNKWVSLFLSYLPFILLILTYAYYSELRHEINPHDKLLPTFSQMYDSIERIAFTEDKRTGDYLALKDTISSLTRLFSGVFIATIIGLLLGLNMGLFKGFNALGRSILTFISMVPPLAILPILFMATGVGEASKITLIVIGIFPIIARDTMMAVKRIPKEVIVKSMTLGANNIALAYQIVLPQIMPRLLGSVRLCLGAAWLFLIASEAIASTDGLGYRIFLVRRYMDMATIIPYVLWITLLGFSFDWLIRQAESKIFPWYGISK